MGYIYCITNLINSKRYVGKTTNDIHQRFNKHCLDSKRSRCEKRPLYDAMNKYGIENFIVEEIEYIEDDNKLEEREIFWIKELGTFGKNGYNATIGGDGKLLYDHNEILELYRMGYNTVQITQKLNCNRTTVANVLKANGIKPRGKSKMLDQFDLAGNFIQTFDCTKDAASWLFSKGITTNKNAHKVLSDCINGRRNNSMYGYKWVAKQIPE